MSLKRREYAHPPEDLDALGAHTRHYSYYEAIMSAPPHAPLELSQEELLPLRECLLDAMDDVLTEMERHIVTSLMSGASSLRIVGRELGLPKTTVARLRDQAHQKLRRALEDQPLIAAYLDGDL